MRRRRQVRLLRHDAYRADLQPARLHRCLRTGPLLVGVQDGGRPRPAQFVRLRHAEGRVRGHAEGSGYGAPGSEDRDGRHEHLRHLVRRRPCAVGEGGQPAQAAHRAAHGEGRSRASRDGGPGCDFGRGARGQGHSDLEGLRERNVAHVQLGRLRCERLARHDAQGLQGPASEAVLHEEHATHRQAGRQAAAGA